MRDAREHDATGLGDRGIAAGILVFIVLKWLVDYSFWGA